MCQMKLQRRQKPTIKKKNNIMYGGNAYGSNEYGGHKGGGIIAYVSKAINNAILTTKNVVGVLLSKITGTILRTRNGSDPTLMK